MPSIRPDLPSDPALDSRLTELRSRFRAALPERVSIVHQRLAALRPGEWPKPAAEALRGEIHSLAGSSGLFGFDGIGAAAQDFEKLLIGIAKQSAASHADMEELLDAMARLDQAAALAIH